MCKWSREIPEYDGLCTHSALREAVAGDFDLSAEELEAEILENRAKAARDGTEQVPQETTKKKGYMKAGVQKSRDKAVKAKMHYCAICDKNYTTSTGLIYHLETKTHLQTIKRGSGSRLVGTL